MFPGPNTELGQPHKMSRRDFLSLSARTAIAALVLGPKLVDVAPAHAKTPPVESPPILLPVDYFKEFLDLTGESIAEEKISYRLIARMTAAYCHITKDYDLDGSINNTYDLGGSYAFNRGKQIEVWKKMRELADKGELDAKAYYEHYTKYYEELPDIYKQILGDNSDLEALKVLADKLGISKYFGNGKGFRTDYQLQDYLLLNGKKNSLFLNGNFGGFASSPTTLYVPLPPEERYLRWYGHRSRALKIHEGVHHIHDQAQEDQVTKTEYKIAHTLSGVIEAIGVYAATGIAPDSEIIFNHEKVFIMMRYLRKTFPQIKPEDFYSWVVSSAFLKPEYLWDMLKEKAEATADQVDQARQYIQDLVPYDYHPDSSDEAKAIYKEELINLLQWYNRRIDGKEKNIKLLSDVLPADGIPTYIQTQGAFDKIKTLLNLPS
jgi:hypothetical protein